MCGTFHTLIQELVEDRELFFRYHRMTLDRFEQLVSLVKVAKKETNF